MSSRILDYVRERKPELADVPDAELTLYLADRKPEFLRLPEFARNVAAFREMALNTADSEARQSVAGLAAGTLAEKYDQMRAGFADQSGQQDPAVESQLRAFEAQQQMATELGRGDVARQIEEQRRQFNAGRGAGTVGDWADTMQPLVSLPRLPAAESVPGQVASGVANAALGFAEGLTSPENLVMLPMGRSPAVQSFFGASMLGGVVPGIRQTAELARQGEVQSAVEAGAGTAAAAVLGAKLARGEAPPPGPAEVLARELQRQVNRATLPDRPLIPEGGVTRVQERIQERRQTLLDPTRTDAGLSDVQAGKPLQDFPQGMNEKPSQTITGSNEEMASEMPVQSRSAKPDRTNSGEAILAQEPLGVKRAERLDPRLATLNESDFDQHYRNVTKELDWAEGKLGEGTGVLSASERKQLAALQDAYASAELDRYRRNIRGVVSQDLLRELRQLSGKAAKFGPGSREFEQANLLLSEMERQGVTREQALSELKAMSPDEAEVFAGQLQDIGEIVRQTVSRTVRPLDPLANPEAGLAENVPAEGIDVVGMGRRVEQKGTEKLPGTRVVAQRMVNAEERFLEFAMQTAGLTREQATTALAEYRKAKAIKFDPVGGQWTFTHGGFAEAEVLRRAAGVASAETPVAPAAESMTKPAEVRPAEPTESAQAPAAAAPAMQGGMDNLRFVSEAVKRRRAGKGRPLVTDAKDAKAKLIGELEKAIEAAPTLEGTDNPRQKVTIEIPGDGTFTVWNTKEQLRELLARAKRLETGKSSPGKAPEARAPKMDVARVIEDARKVYGDRRAADVLQRQAEDMGLEIEPKQRELLAEAALRLKNSLPAEPPPGRVEPPVAAAESIGDQSLRVKRLKDNWDAAEAEFQARLDAAVRGGFVRRVPEQYGRVDGPSFAEFEDLNIQSRHRLKDEMYAAAGARNRARLAYKEALAEAPATLNETPRESAVAQTETAKPSKPVMGDKVAVMDPAEAPKPAPRTKPTPKAKGKPEPWQMTRLEYSKAAANRSPEPPVEFQTLDAIANRNNRSPHNPDAITEQGVRQLKADGLITGTKHFKLTESGRSKLHEWRRDVRDNYNAEADAADEHYELVRTALEQGKPVPARVFGEYETLIPLADKAIKALESLKVNTGAAGDPRQPQGQFGLPSVPPGTATAIPAKRMVVTMERLVPGFTTVAKIERKLSEIVDVARGISDASPIRSNRLSQRWAGVYTTPSRVIRMWDRLNLPTTAHEVAHALADALYATTAVGKVRGIPTAAGRELVALGKALYGKTRPNAGYAGEGWAELVSDYLTTDDIARRAPNATAWLEGTVLPAFPEVAKAMREARAEIDVWRGMGARERMRAQTGSVDSKLSRLRQEVARFASREGFVEQFAPYEALGKRFKQVAGRELSAAEDPFQIATARRGQAGAILAYMADEGMIDPAGNRTGGRSLRESLAPVTKGLRPDQVIARRRRAADFWSYLWARRAIERWGQDKNPGISLADAQYLKQSLERPEFQLAAARYYEWWDGILDYLGKSSPGNAELVNRIRNGSRDYVPLARVLDANQTRPGGNFGVGGALRRMRGSSLPVKELDVQTLMAAEQVIARAHRDQVMESIFHLAQQPGMGALIEEVPRAKVREQVNVEKLRQQLEGMGVDTTNIPADTLLEYYTGADAPKGSDPIVARKVNGETKWFYVRPDLFAALEGIQPARLPLVADLLLGVPARTFRLGTTGLRPAFSLITNPARDLQTFLMQSTGSANPFRRTVEYFGALGDVVRSGLTGKASPYVDLFQRLGIMAGQPLGGDVGFARREAKGLFHGRLFKRVTAPVETLRELLSFTEAVPRVAELRLRAKEMGWAPGLDLTPEQALSLTIAAKRVTTDFSAGGSYAKLWSQAIPFFNASIQGTRGFLRTVQERPAQAVLYGVSMFTLPALYTWWRNKDEEWYRALPWRERYLYWNVPDGNGNVYQIPRPPEWQSAFAVVPEALLDAAYRDNPEAVNAAFGHMAAVANPFDLPVLGNVAWEQARNRIGFFDRPIVRPAQEGLRPGEQVGPYTSWLATTLGRAFPETISPMRIDHLVRGVGGGAAADTVAGLEQALGLRPGSTRQEPSEIPVAGKLLRRGGEFSAVNRQISELYDLHFYWQARARNRELEPRLKAYATLLDNRMQSIRFAQRVAEATEDLRARQSIYRDLTLTAETLLKDAKAGKLLATQQ